MNYNFIIFIDDLSFEKIDSDYKIIKSTLDGSIQNQPKNIVLYVTSNRRHLMPRDMIENERSSAIHTDESVEEKISLSDRFGLWIGFHNISQNEFVTIMGIKLSPDLSVALIFVSVLNNEKSQFVEERLSERKYDVKQFLARSIGKKIRKIPEIKFILDSSEHDASRINKIISDLDIPPKN